MERNSPTYRTLWNAIYGFIGYAWPIALALFVTPIIVLNLGIKNYGLYIFINTISGLVGLLDLGVAASFIKYTAEYSSARENNKLQHHVTGANLIFLLVALIGFLVIIAASLVSHDRVGGNVTKSIYYACFFLAAGIFFVNTGASSFYSIPTALQRLDLGKKIGLTRVTLTSLTIVGFLLAGYGLVAVFAITLFYDLIFAVVFWFAARRMLPGISFWPGWQPAEMRRCYQFGLVYFVSNWANQLLYQLDKLLIPYVFGPTQLAYYSLPGTVTTKIQGLTGGLAAVMMPLSSQLQGQGDRERLRRVYARGFRLLFTAAFGLTAAVVIYAHDILFYWLSADVADNSSQVLVILAITYLILALFVPLNNFLLGLGKTKELAYFSLLMLVLNVMFLVILLPIYGIVGAAWAFLLSVLPVLGLFRYTETRILNLTGQMVTNLKLLIKNLTCAALLYMLVVFFLRGLISSLFSRVAVFGVSLAFYYSAFVLLRFLDSEDSRMARDFMVAVFRPAKRL